MFSGKSKINSQGEKIKKFKMPKFPSAVVILFIVLVFVVLLSWIPHKGWADTSSPFLKFEGGMEGYIYGNSGTILGEYSITPGSSIESLDGWEINFWLVDSGQDVLRLYLDSLGISYYVIEPIIGQTDVSSGGFTISNIVLNPKFDGDKFYQSSINYSDLTFVLTFNGEIKNIDGEVISFSYLQDDPSSNSIMVTVDRIYQGDFSLVEGECEVDSMSFSIISGETSDMYKYVGTDIVEEEIDEEMVPVLFAGASFMASNSKGKFFNFWNTNYFVGDINGTYGLLNLPFILLAGFFNATGVILYLLCIGAFIEVMLQSGALEAGTSSLVKKLGGKELLLIPILFILFCTGGTMYGMQEETLGLLPLIVPFLVLAGFDTMTGLLVVVVGTTSGIAASVTDPFSVGVMSGALQTPEAKAEGVKELAISTGIVLRIVEFLVFAFVGSLFCTWYGWRSRKGMEHVAEPEMYEANKEWAQEMLGAAHEEHSGLTRRQMIGLIIFGGTFGVMIFALLPWTSWFPDLGSNSRGFWFMFSSLFYSGSMFGEWYFVQLGCMFLAVSLILGKVFGMKQKETNTAMVNGMKGMFGIAMILTISRGVSLVLSYSGLTTSLIAMMFGGAGGAGEPFSGAALSWILLPIFSFLAVFIPSTSGLAGITGPIIGPIIWTIGGVDNYVGYAALVMAVYPLAQGIINMCSPTTGLVVAQAEISRVNFGKAFPILAGCAVVTALLGMLLISCAAPIYIDPVAVA